MQVKINKTIDLAQLASSEVNTASNQGLAQAISKESQGAEQDFAKILMAKNSSSEDLQDKELLLGNSKTQTNDDPSNITKQLNSDKLKTMNEEGVDASSQGDQDLLSNLLSKTPQKIETEDNEESIVKKQLDSIVKTSKNNESLTQKKGLAHQKAPSIDKILEKETFSEAIKNDLSPKNEKLVDIVREGGPTADQLKGNNKLEQSLVLSNMKNKNAQSDLSLLEFAQKLNKSNKSNLSNYKKEVQALNTSLIRTPIHQELIENNQKMDPQDGSFNSGEQNLAEDMLGFDQLEKTSNSKESSSTDIKTQKTLDLSHVKSDSKSALIKEVANYIEQSYVANRESVDLLVKHEEMGNFRVLAQKSGAGQQISLEISTGSKEAQQFFAQNETELMKTLQESGVKLSQMKIVAKSDIMIADVKQTAFEQSGQDQRGESRHQQHRHGQEAFSQRGSSHREGGERRQQLWQNAQKFREQQLAA